MSELADTLVRCQKWVERFKGQGKAVGEENTKAGLIEPILSALGWDITDPDEVHREYKSRSWDNPVDYALLFQRNPCLFVEAKGIAENLNDQKWANQTIAYATIAGVRWVVLTNGAEWRIYNALAGVGVERKLFKTIRVDDDSDEAFSVLTLLSKSEMHENRIDALWKSFFIDRTVKDILDGFFSGTEPARDLVSAVRRRAPELPLKDVRASLTRARAIFEFPPVPGPLPGTPVVTPPRSSKGKVKAAAGMDGGVPTGSAANKAWAKRHALEEWSLPKLVTTGWIAVGAEIETRYDNTRSVARVEADGTITFAGKNYPSTSAAGKAVKIAMRGEGLPASVLSTDGWKFWRTKGKSGELVTLRDLRDQAAQGGVGPT